MNFGLQMSFSGRSRPVLEGQVQNLVATGGDSEVTLNWSAVAGATGYQIERKQGDQAWLVLIADTGTTATTRVNSPVNNGVVYGYRVSAIIAGSPGPASFPAFAFPSAIVPVIQSVSVGTFENGSLPFTIAAEAGTVATNDPVFWVIYPSDASAPSVAQVKAGLQQKGSAATESGSGNWPGSFSDTLIAGIARGNYKLSAVIEGAAGDSNVGESAAFEIDTTAPVLSSATGTENAGDIDWSVTSNEATGTIYAAIRLAANPVLSATNIINGTGNAVDTSTEASPAADGSNGGTFTAPASGTYRVDVVQVDDYDNESAVVSSSEVVISSGASFTDDHLGYAVDVAITTSNSDYTALLVDAGTSPIVRSGGVVERDNNYDAVVHSEDYSGVDWFAEITVRDPGIDTRLLFGHNGSTTWDDLYYLKISDTALDLVARTGGVETSLANPSHTFTTDDVFGLRRVGNDLQIWINGVQVGASVTDTTHSGGRAGYLIADSSREAGVKRFATGTL